MKSQLERCKSLANLVTSDVRSLIYVTDENISEDDSGDGDSACKKSKTTASNSPRVRLDLHHLFLLAMSL